MQNVEKIEISEIEVIPVRPRDGLVGFASCVLNGQIYLGGIAIHSDLKNHGLRLVYPAKKLLNGTAISIFHPITKQTGERIQRAIIEAWDRLFSDSESVVDYELESTTP